MAVACFALGVTACSANDEAPSVDAAAGNGITAPPESVESMAVADSPDDQIEVATAFWEAVASADRDVALSFVDPAFVESGAGDPFGRARTLERPFDWYEAVGWEWSLEGCTRGDAGAVECTATASNAWSDALGVEPVTGTFVVSFGDDGILTVNELSASFSSQWSPMVFEVFRQWVRSNHRFERNKPASESRGVFSADGSGVVLFGGDDEVHVVSLDTGAVLVLNTRQEVVEDVSAPAAGSPLLVTGDGDTEVWEATAKGHPALGNLPTTGRIDELWFSGDGSRVLVVEAVASPSGPHRRIGDFDQGSARVRRSATTTKGPIVASDELVAIASQDDSAGRVESFDGSVIGAGLGPCDVPRAIDDAGRWLLVSSDASTCGSLAGRIVDPLTGEVLAELPDRRVDSADIGPAGTLAEGLLVTRVGIVRDFGGGPPADEVVDHAIEVRRMPDGELVGSIFDDEPPLEYLRPRFSADGRHIAIGRDRSGGLLVDVQRLLAGESMRNAIVANDDLYLGTTTIADAGGGWLVGRSSSVLRFFDLDLGTVTMTLPLDEGGAFKVTREGDAIYYADGGVVRRFPLDHTELAALARSMAQEW